MGESPPYHIHAFRSCPPGKESWFTDKERVYWAPCCPPLSQQGGYPSFLGVVTSTGKQLAEGDGSQIENVSRIRCICHCWVTFKHLGGLMTCAMPLLSFRLATGPPGTDSSITALPLALPAPPLNAAPCCVSRTLPLPDPDPLDPRVDVLPPLPPLALPLLRPEPCADPASECQSPRCIFFAAQSSAACMLPATWPTVEEISPSIVSRALWCTGSFPPCVALCSASYCAYLRSVCETM